MYVPKILSNAPAQVLTLLRHCDSTYKFPIGVLINVINNSDLTEAPLYKK